MSKELVVNKDFKYKRLFAKISGYTTTYNSMDYPFEESIRSMLGFCDEVVVVDGCSTDGTWEVLQKLSEEDPRVKTYQNEFDWSEPRMDGAQKAFARALCENEYLWQMDADEVVHEDDYEKIKMITKRFPKNADVLDLPVIELWGPKGEVTGRRHSWKWRMSKNKPEITHDVNVHARVTDQETGRVYAKKGMSDGCEYVNTMNYEMVPHVGFYTPQMEQARLMIPDQYAAIMNQGFSQLPSVYHYSWFDLPRKIKQLKKGEVWDKMWSLLYKEETQNRFPEIETEEDLVKLSKKLYDQGGEDSDEIKYKFMLLRTQPSLMQEWIRKHINL
jgi:glycosyltransferase involved in cell wall biosynthesis